MNWSRRDLSFLLPALAAAQTSGQTGTLPSSVLNHDEIPARKSGTIVMRQMAKGTTHTGFLVDLHESELPAGEAPHPPHHHVHEELLLIREGTLEVTVAGKGKRLGPGSAAYLASNQEHGWRNVGTTTAKYFVLALGEDTA